MSATLSVVVPAFNEADSLEELLERCVAACTATGRPYEIVIVDDGSTDDSERVLTAGVARYPGHVRAVFLNRNYGQHNAVLCGLAHAGGDVVVTLDADLQNPPEEIPRLVQKMDEGYDVVGTIRVPRRDSLLRRVASRAINRLVRQATGVSMSDYGCMLRAYSRRVVLAMLACRERSTFVPVLANGFARHTAEIEVAHAPRKSGESKYGLGKLVHLMFDLMTTTTTTPLRIMTIAGVVLFAGGASLGVLLLGLRLFYGAEWAGGGVFTLFSVLFFFLGAQFAAMGLLGEYLGRIQIDVRERPRYFIDHAVGASSLDSVREVDVPRPFLREQYAQ